MPLRRGCSAKTRKKNLHELKVSGRHPNPKQRIAIELDRERREGCPYPPPRPGERDKRVYKGRWHHWRRAHRRSDGTRVAGTWVKGKRHRPHGRN